MNISVNDIPFYLKKNLKLCLKEETVVSTVLIFTAKKKFKKNIFRFYIFQRKFYDNPTEDKHFKKRRNIFIFKIKFQLFCNQNITNIHCIN